MSSFDEFYEKWKKQKGITTDSNYKDLSDTQKAESANTVVNNFIQRYQNKLQENTKNNINIQSPSNNKSSIWNDIKSTFNNLMLSGKQGVMQVFKGAETQLEANKNYKNQKVEQFLTSNKISDFAKAEAKTDNLFNKNIDVDKNQTTLSDRSPLLSIDQAKIENGINKYKNSISNGKVDTNLTINLLQNNIDETSRKIQENTNSINNEFLKKANEQVVPSLGQMGAGMIVSAINPALGTLYFTESAVGSYYDDAKQRGMSDNEARKYSTIMGAMEGATEQVGIKNLSKAGKGVKALISGTGKEGVKKILKGEAEQITKTTLKTVLKDYGIGIADNVMQEAIIDPIQELTAQTVAGKDKAQWEDIRQKMLQDGINGGLVSAILGGANLGIQSCAGLVEKVNSNQQFTQQEVKTAVQDASQQLDVGQMITDSTQQQINKYKEYYNSNNNPQNLQQDTTQNQIKQQAQQITPVQNGNTSNSNMATNNLKENALNEINNSKISDKAKKEMLDVLNSMDNVTEADIKAIKQSISEVDKTELEINTTYKDSLTRKRNYIKYKNDTNAYDSQAFYEVLDVIPSNRNGNRTVKQWLKVADELGRRISDKSNSEIEQIAYKSWFDAQPTKNITKYDNVNKTNVGFQKLTSDDWINAINNAVLQQREQTIQQQNKMSQNGNIEQVNSRTTPITEKQIKPTIKDFNESAKQYNIDFNNEDLQEINQMFNKRGIKAYFDENTFKNNNDAFSVWKPATDEQGNISGREVVFNPNAKDSKIRVQELAIHELGHDLDLNEVQDMILKDASRKENWESARKSLENTYREVYKNDGINISEEEFNKIVDEEATMSILQRELGSQEYINRLVNQNQSIAKKIYNWVIDKLNKFTGGKNEKIFWTDVKNKFETAYNQEFNKNENSFKYSVGGNGRYVKSKNSSVKIDSDGDAKYIDENQEEHYIYFRFDNEGDFRGKKHKSGVSMWEEFVDDLISDNYESDYDENDNYIEKNRLLEEYGLTQEQYDNMSYDEQLKIKRKIAQDKGYITDGASVFDLSTYGTHFFRRYEPTHHLLDYSEVNFFTGEATGEGADGENVVIPDKILLKTSSKDIKKIYDDLDELEWDLEDKGLSEDEVNEKVNEEFTKRLVDLLNEKSTTNKKSENKAKYPINETKYNTNNYSYNDYINRWKNKFKPSETNSSQLAEKQFEYISNLFKENGIDLKLLDYIGSNDVYNGSGKQRQYKTVQEYENIAKENKNIADKNLKEVKEDSQKMIEEKLQDEKIKNNIIKENGITEKQYEKEREASIFRNRKNKELDLIMKEIGNQESGYYKNKKSIRSIKAESEGKFSLDVASKMLGVSKKSIEEYITPTEWHHSGGNMYNKINYYDISKYIDLAENGIDTYIYDNNYQEEIKNWLKMRNSSKTIIDYKKQSSNDNIRYMKINTSNKKKITMDSKGRKLSKEQQEFFKDSKVIDEKSVTNTDNINAKDNQKFSSNNRGEWQQFLDNNYKKQGTGKNLKEYNLPTKEDIKLNLPTKETINQQDIQPTQGEKIDWNEIERPEGKIRKHYRSIIESSNTTKEAKAIAKELMGTDTYTPDSNKSQLQRADIFIEKYGVNKAIDRLMTNLETNNFTYDGVFKRVGVDDIALGERLIQYFSKTGDSVNLQNAIQATAMAGSEAGRAVQALSILNHQTPQGQATWIQRSVDKMNNELAERKGGTITKDSEGNIRVINKKGQDITDKVDLFNLTPDMIEKIVNSKNKNEMYDNIAQVYEDLGQQVSLSTMEKIDSWRYFSMLANPKTHIRNMVGNFAMGKTQRIKDKLAGGIEDIVGTFYKGMERTKTLRPADAKTKEFAKNDVLNPDVQSMMELNENKYNPQSRLQNARKTFKNDMLNNTLGRLFNWNDKLLEAEDALGLKSAYKKALTDYLTANKIDVDNITDKQLSKARNYAVEQAKEATFHQANAIATFINQISNKNKVAKGIKDAILPFVKTPLNVAKTGIEYNPAGLLKTITYDTVKLRKGEITVNKYIDNLSKGLTGTGIAVLGYALADAGILKASGGDDDKKEKYDEALGKQTYSMTIGDRTYSLDWLAPVGIPLFVGAEAKALRNSQKEEKSSISSDDDKKYNQALKSLENLANALANSMSPMAEMSMISGLTSALQSYENDSAKMFGTMGTNAVKSYVNQFVPTLLGQVARTTDDYERSTTSTKNGVLSKAIDQTKLQVMSKVPGLRQKLPTKTDIWGNEQKSDLNLPVRGFNNFINPATVKNVNTSKVDEEINKLYDSTGETKILPSTIDKKYTINGKIYRMTDEEYAKYKKDYGQTSYELLDSLVKSKEYNKLSDEQKQKAIENVYSYAKEKNKVDYATKNKQEVETSTLYNTLEDLKKNGGEQSQYLNYLGKTIGIEKQKEKNQILADSNYTDKTKSIIYANITGKKDDLYNSILSKDNIDINEYLNYKLQEFESDTEDDGTLTGKAISGSKKEKMYSYVNDMNITENQKIAILGKQYKLNRQEQIKLYNYINSIKGQTKDEKN